MGLSLAERRRAFFRYQPRLNFRRVKTAIHLYLKQAEQFAICSAMNGTGFFNANKVQAWKLAPFRITIVCMLQVGLFAMHVLEVLFFVGMAGSAIVVVISFVEDAQELFGED